MDKSYAIPDNSLVMYSELSPTGLVWLVNAGRAIRGNAAGSVSNDGYYVMAWAQRQFKVHRVIAYIEGLIDEAMFLDKQVVIDHIDGDKLNNKLDNLKVVDSRTNSQNKQSHREGRLVGASYYPKTGKWKSQISVNGKKIHLGYFATEQQASDAYFSFIRQMMN